jgi:hypothetical protein
MGTLQGVTLAWKSCLLSIRSSHDLFGISSYPLSGPERGDECCVSYPIRLERGWAFAGCFNESLKFTSLGQGRKASGSVKRHVFTFRRWGGRAHHRPIACDHQRRHRPGHCGHLLPNPSAPGRLQLCERRVRRLIFMTIRCEVFEIRSSVSSPSNW